MGNTIKNYSTEKDRWQALLNRDSESVSKFFYAVKTTGIYCHPNCSSRLPNRKNVEFFDSREEAEKAGYRACKRCKPQSISQQTAIEQKIIMACRSIEASEAHLKLEDLAKEAGLSPYHFHRQFKKIVGLTPKQYSLSHTSKRFEQRLKTDESVTEAIYSAGYSSSSGAYSKQHDRLAMKPKVYRKGAEGVTITYGIAECFLGWIIVAATEIGVCAIEFDDDPNALPPMVQNRFPKALLQKAGPDFTGLIKDVVQFIRQPDKARHIPLDIQGTAFQQQVWNVLRQIKPGHTLSYTEVAEKIGKPEAVRAVATACASNKIGVLIPCHRVITKDGRISGYRWGVDRKKQLLEREKKAADKA